jgi:DUF1707 SHOCT-like domain
MAGLENEMAADSGRGRQRASDADREHVVNTLKAAYVHGLVTKDEFDARVSQVFAARTYAELAVITADIPAGLAAAQQPPRPTPARGNAPAHANVGPGDRAIIATAVFAVLALAISISAGPFASPAAVLLVFGGAGSAFVSLFLLRSRMRGSRRDKRPGGQLPPQRGVDSGGSNAAHRAISATSAERFPHVSKPRRRGNADAARHHTLRPQVSSWFGESNPRDIVAPGNA